VYVTAGTTHPAMPSVTVTYQSLEWAMPDQVRRAPPPTGRTMLVTRTPPSLEYSECIVSVVYSEHYAGDAHSALRNSSHVNMNRKRKMLAVSLQFILQAIQLPGGRWGGGSIEEVWCSVGDTVVLGESGVPEGVLSTIPEGVLSINSTVY
jgi:hypothetical protein